MLNNTQVGSVGSTVSKALDKSRNMLIVYSFSSTAVAILSTSCIMAC